MRFYLLFQLFIWLIAQTVTGNNSPEKGIYDGKIGNDQIILVVEETNSEIVKGFYVLNRNKAVEERHSFSLGKTGSRLIFQSDLYLGIMKSAEISSDNFSGTLSLLNKKKRFFFWRQKASLNFVKSRVI